MGTLNNGVRLTWLGHSTWIIESPAGTRVLVDPWVDGNPACPDEMKGAGLGQIDLILCTHGHGDHVGDLLSVASQTGAPVAGIFDLTEWAASQGVATTVGGNKGGTMVLDDLSLKITLVHAVHSSSMLSNGVSMDMGDPCGFILELENGYRIYNCGDTDVFGDMALIAELYEPDLVMMPIGDWFTMGPRQAAKAVELLGATRVVPQHYGTFPLLSGTPDALRALVGDGVEILDVAPGGTID